MINQLKTLASQNRAKFYASAFDVLLECAQEETNENNLSAMRLFMGWLDKRVTIRGYELAQKEMEKRRTA